MNLYLIFKSLHIISVMCWVASLLYLPRIFVYHSKVLEISDSYKIFKIMERKLIYIIMIPSMFFSYVFGLLMIYFIGMSHIWLHIKFSLIIILTIFHFFLIRCYKNFAENQNLHQEKFFRIINEIPTIIMIIVVFLAVTKPL